MRLSARFRLSGIARSTIAAVASIVALGCNSGSTPERPNDPWIFRSVMDLQPRMITLALSDDLWVSYNASTGELYRAWPGGVDFAGPVYNQAHGPQPTSVGPAYLVGDGGGAFAVRTEDTEYVPDVRFRGHRVEGASAVLLYTIILTDGTEATVTESPERTGGENGVRLARTFVTDGIPVGVEISVRTDSTEPGQSRPLVSNGTTVVEHVLDGTPVQPFRIAPAADAVEGSDLVTTHNCQICHNVDVQTVGPAYKAVADRYEFTPFNVDRLARKVMAGGSGEWGQAMMTPHPALSVDDARELVRYILSLDGETEKRGPATSGVDLSDDRSNSAREGLVVNAWRVQGSIPGLIEPASSEKPAYSGVVETLNIEGQGFAPFEENFYLEARGFVRIEQPGNYVFRLVSDDGSILYFDGEELVNNDGFHGPDPSDGEIQLAAGEYPVFVRFFQGGGGRTLSLQWVKHGDQAFTVVPANVLRYDEADKMESAPFVAATPRVKGIPGDRIPLLGVHPSFALETIRPDGFEPMVGGLDVGDDGRVYVTTWDSEGAVYVLDEIPDEVTSDDDRNSIRVTRIAHGLAEPLGVKIVDGAVYVLQKHELTKLMDRDADGLTDEYQTVANGWGATANFHEFAFGLEYVDGYFYGTLATAILPGGASADPQNRDRGRVIRINPITGSHEFVASGLRTPNGIGRGVDGELFVADNQGDWLPSSKILHITEGAFLGSRSVDFAGTAGVAEKPPVVWLPQNEIGNSPSQPASLNVGPYQNQMIHGEVTHGGLKRVFVDVVDGEYQGAVFRFTQGVEAGVNRIAWGPDGKLYIGGIGNPGNWGHTGGNWFGLQRMTYTGGDVFEMLAVRAKSDGVELEFTEPLGETDGFDAGAYLVQQFRYVPTADYGGPKVDERDLRIRSVNVSEDRKRVFLQLDGMRPGHVIYIRLLEPWISANGNGLWSREAWYTMNRIPSGARGFRSSIAATRAVPNDLTPQEVAAGWKLLFDGQTLAGWRNYNSDSIGEAWRVEDGAITLGGANADWQTVDGGDIITDESYTNYDLRLEWKISPGGNSGIIYNVVEDPKYEYVWETGPEMQVLDNDGHGDGAIVSHRAGELYDLVALPYEPVNPVGEWNSVRIVQRDGHVEHWLNGHKLLEAQIGSPEWNAMVAGSKFIDMPDFGKSKSGHIALQDHGDRVWYRGIRIREL